MKNTTAEPDHGGLVVWVRPVPAACAIADTERGERGLFNQQSHAIWTFDGRPIGECRLRLKKVLDRNAESIKTFCHQILKKTTHRHQFECRDIVMRK